MPILLIGLLNKYELESWDLFWALIQLIGLLNK